MGTQRLALSPFTRNIQPAIQLKIKDKIQHHFLNLLYFMTPEENAKDLVESFHKINTAAIAGTNTIFKDLAKKCAILCVDEIMKSNAQIAMIYDLSGHDNTYWQKVKSIIQSM